MQATTNFETPPWRTIEVARRGTLRKMLLICGVLSTLYYVGTTAYVTAQAEGYSSISQAVSELSAIGASTRPLWVALGIPYTLLVIAFGWGVWRSAEGSRALRTVGALYVAEALLGSFWPPMHQRGAETTLTDTLHIVWTAGWLAVMLAAMVLAAVALGRRFRIYTFATLVVFAVFGTLTSIEGARLAADLPTPYIGLWERINMGAGMLWNAVLAVALLRRRDVRVAAASRPLARAIITSLLLLAAPLAVGGQSRDEGGDEGGGYFGAPVVEYTRLREQDAAMIGGRGGWNVTRSLTLGGGLYGTLTEVDAPPDVTDAPGPLDLEFEVFGLEAEYTLRRDEPVQITVGTFLGGAAARYVRDGTNEQHGETDFLLLVEPAAGVEREIVGWLRLSLAGTYRLVAGVEQEGLSAGDLDGPAVRLSAKLGRF